MATLYKTKVSIDGNPHTTILNAYTDGTTWNGWLNVSLTRDSLLEWMNESPYDVRILPCGNAILCFEDAETLECANAETVDGILPLYNMNGYCFSEIEQGES